MCGRYVLLTEEDLIDLQRMMAELNRRFEGTPEFAEMKTGEIFPTNIVPIIASGGPELMTWGFRAFGNSGVVINARSETAAEKPMFASALKAGRVAVPTTGFFEWKREGKKSTDKVLFRLPGQKILYLAGVSVPDVDENGRVIRRFAILTTAANDSMKAYHDRMPVYIARSELKGWMDDPKITLDIMNRRQPALEAALVRKENKEDAQLSMFD